MSVMLKSVLLMPAVVHTEARDIRKTRYPVFEYAFYHVCLEVIPNYIGLQRKRTGSVKRERIMLISQSFGKKRILMFSHYTLCRIVAAEWR